MSILELRGRGAASVSLPLSLKEKWFNKWNRDNSYVCWHKKGGEEGGGTVGLDKRLCGHFNAQCPEKELQSCAHTEPRRASRPRLCCWRHALSPEDSRSCLLQPLTSCADLFLIFLPSSCSGPTSVSSLFTRQRALLKVLFTGMD